MNIKVDWLSAGFMGAVLITLAIMPFVNKCEAEDGNACTWYAQEQGNGVGTSFTDYYGIKLYHLGD